MHGIAIPVSSGSHYFGTHPKRARDLQSKASIDRRTIASEGFTNRTMINFPMVVDVVTVLVPQMRYCNFVDTTTQDGFLQVTVSYPTMYFPFWELIDSCKLASELSQIADDSRTFGTYRGQNYSTTKTVGTMQSPTSRNWPTCRIFLPPSQ